MFDIDGEPVSLRVPQWMIDNAEQGLKLWAVRHSSTDIEARDVTMARRILTGELNPTQWDMIATYSGFGGNEIKDLLHGFGDGDGPRMLAQIRYVKSGQA